MLEMRGGRQWIGYLNVILELILSLGIKSLASKNRTHRPLCIWEYEVVLYS